MYLKETLFVFCTYFKRNMYMTVLYLKKEKAAYGVALVSRIDKIIGLFCKRALQKRRYSAKETYNFIDPTDCSHPICAFTRPVFLPMYKKERKKKRNHFEKT